MTTDTFAIGPSFFSIITPADAGTSQFGPNGRTNEGVMRGLDENHYVFVEGSGHDYYVLCAETGNVTTITQTRFLNDLADIGSPVIEVDSGLCLSAPNTPYVWVIAFQANGAEIDYLVGGILYKIVADGTVNAVGGLAMRTEAGGPREGRYLSNSNNFYSTCTIGNSLLALGQVHSSVFDDGLVVVMELPLAEEVIAADFVGSFSELFTDTPGIFGDHFFDFVNTIRTNPGPACIVPIGTSDYGIMVNVDQAVYDYVHAHPGVNSAWDTLTGPAVLWWKSGTGSYTDVTSHFDLSDALKHLDGSVSASYYDNYCGPNSFKIGDRTYVAYSRSYTQASDLEPVGTYARLKIFLWDGSTSTLSFDGSSALFDPVADCGVDESQRTSSYPQFVQACYDPFDSVIYYVWYGEASSLVFDYVFGPWGTGTRGTELAYVATFSEFVNPSFTDWQTSDTSGFGADFSSYLVTYYMLQSDTMLFFEAPYVYCYLENSERAPVGLTMQPQWDWAEDPLSHKLSRSTEVYRSADLTKVAVSQNRVRGRGRALRLKYISEQSKDFNLLGWSVSLESNARY